MYRPLAALVAGLPLVFAVACAPAPRVGPPPGPPVDSLQISVSGCTTDTPVFAVRPSWSARAARGATMRWRMNGADSFSIVPRDEQFWGLPQPAPATAPANASITVAIPPAAPLGSRHYYNIVLRCGDRVYTIDPDIMVDF